jgi:hypothetical protein
LPSTCNPPLPILSFSAVYSYLPSSLSVLIIVHTSPFPYLCHLFIPSTSVCAVCLYLPSSLSVLIVHTSYTCILSV